MYATLAIKNARIMTMENNRECSAMAIIEERIVAIGSYRDIEPFIGQETELVDAMGACILPGFIDTQVNLLDNAFYLSSEDLSFVRSKEALIQQLKKSIIEKDIKEKQWLFGHGTSLVSVEKTYLSQKDLNRISIHHPILILGLDGQSALINEKGMALLHRTGSCHLSGKDLDWLKSNIFSHYSIEELKENILKTTAHLSKKGITSIHTDDRFGFGYRGRINDLYRAYEQLASANKLCQRIYHQMQVLSDQALKEQFKQPFRSGDGNDWFKLGAIKFYGDRGTYGDATLARYIEDCHKNGFQLSLEARNLEDLESYKKTFYQLSQTYKSKRQLRHILQLKEKGIGMAVEEDLLISSYGRQSMLKKRPPTLFERMQEISQHKCYGLNNHTTTEDLIAMFTINAAKTEYGEHQKGSLKIGKLADFILADKNPYDLGIEALGDIQVMQTFVNGKSIYKS